MMHKLLTAMLLMLLCCSCAIAEECDHQWDETDVLETCDAVTTVYTCRLCGVDRLNAVPTGKQHPETDCLLTDYCEYWLVGCGYCDEVLSREMADISHDYFNPLSRVECGMKLYTCPRCHGVIMRTGFEKARHNYHRKGDMQVCTVCGDTRCYPDCEDTTEVWDDFRMLWIKTCHRCRREQTHPDEIITMPDGKPTLTNHDFVRCCTLPGSPNVVILANADTPVLVVDTDHVQEDYPSRLWARVVYDGRIWFIPQEYLDLTE